MIAQEYNRTKILKRFDKSKVVRAIPFIERIVEILTYLWFISMLNAPFSPLCLESQTKKQVRKKPSFSLPDDQWETGSLCETSWIRNAYQPWKRYVINDVRTTTYRDTSTDKILTEARSFRLFCLWNGETTRNERLRASFTFMICIRSRIMSLSIEAHRAFLLSLLQRYVRGAHARSR